MLGIVNFHKVLGERDEDIFTIDLKECVNIINCLRRQGTIVRPDFVENSWGEEAKNFLLSFDDGTMDHFDQVSPLLSDHDIKGVFFVPSGKIDKKGYVGKYQLLELVKMGHTIGAHGHSHSPLTSLSDDDFKNDIDTSIKRLEDIIGEAIEWFAPPGGIYNARTIDLVQNYKIRYFRTIDFGWNRQIINNNFLKMRCFNISSFFLSNKLEKCMLSKFIYCSMATLFAIRRKLKKISPSHYNKMRAFINKIKDI